MKSAIIGCGRIAHIHALALLANSNVQLIACADINKAKADDFADKYSLKPYASMRELINEEHPDVLHICTPHYLHADMAIEALRQGIHVFLEKPAAMDRLSFEKLMLAEQASQTQIGVCFQNRYNDSVVYLREKQQSGHFGKALGARCFVTWRRDADYYADEWHGRKALEGGGALINQAIHTMDLLVLLLGTPVDVQCSMHNRHLKDIIEVEDTVEAYIRFPTCNALFYASMAHCTDAPIFLEISYEKACVRLIGDELSIKYFDGTLQSLEKSEVVPLGKSYWGTSHRLCIEDFYQCVNQGRNFPITPDSIKPTMDLVYGCYEAAESNTTISPTQERT